MINRHWNVVDIDVLTWRKIAPLMTPNRYFTPTQPGEHELYVLHDGERILRAIDTTTGRCAEIYAHSPEQPQQLAQELYASGRWDRVHVINKYHLEHVAIVAQQPAQRRLTMDEYYQMIYRQLWDAADGYAVQPPQPGHWNHWTYAELREIATRYDNSSLALVAVAAGRTEVGLIAELREGTLHTVTTLEAFGYPPPVFEVSQAGFDALWQQLEARSVRPGAVLLCTWEVCQEWVAAADKQAVLEQAIQRSEAFLRLEPSRAPTEQQVPEGAQV